LRHALIRGLKKSPISRKPRQAALQEVANIYAMRTSTIVLAVIVLAGNASGVHLGANESDNEKVLQ
jgi:hypothetical protein